MNFGLDTFIVRLSDDSMEPVFLSGDFVYVDPDVPMRSGDMVAVRRTGMTKVRQIKEQGGRLVLRTLTPDEIECVVTASNETMIAGVVVFWGRKV